MERHTQEYRDWLASLKPGDRVHVAEGFRGLGCIRVVKRVTKTQISVGPGEDDSYVIKYCASGGHQKGVGTWDRSTELYPLTEEVLERMRARVYRNKLGKAFKTIEYSRLTNDQLEAILKIAGIDF